MVPPAVSPAFIELESPFETFQGTVRLLEPADSDRDALRERLKAGRYDKPFVIDDGETRTLHFCDAFVQSEMRLADPFALEVEYTRTIMGFLLLAHDPRAILLLGLGGGSLAKFCHRHLPGARITAVEVDPHVLAFRGQFLVPPEDERFRVVQADAGEYVRRARERADVIVMDAFDRHGYASSIGSADFYAAARHALSPRGVMVANLVGERRERVAHLERMRSSFSDNILVVPVQDDGNHVAFAFRDPAFEPRWRWMHREAPALGRRYGLDFPRLAGQLERSRKLGYLQRVMEHGAAGP